jgi:RHS repeat-associated protein
VARDAQRRITRLTSPSGRFVDFAYDGSNRITEAEDLLGRTVGYEYGASGRLWKVIDAKGGITEFSYDASHRMLTISHGEWIRSDHADGRDRSARLRATGLVQQCGPSDTEALGEAEEQTTTYARLSGSNLVETATDELGRVTKYEHDSKGNPTSVTRLFGTADAVTTTFTYEPTFSLLTSVTDPLSRATAFAYDGAGRLTSLTDPLNHQTTFTSNGAGQVLSVTNAENETTSFTYELGDLIGITTPLGHTETRWVDVAGRLRRVTDAKGATTLFDYDNLNQLTKITDPLAGETTFTYDGNGNLLTLTDTRSKTTTWTYTSMDRVQTRTDPLSRQESFGYDLMGNLTTWTDRKNQVTTYQYDGLDRQTFAGFGTTGSPPTYQSTITYTYDAGDRLTQVVDSAAGTITRGYDLLDRLTAETTPEGSISYTYDDADRRATMQVAGQPQVSYAYDDADRLTGITQASSNVTIAHDDTNRRTSVTLPNGVVMAYGYDIDSRLTGITYTHGMSTLGTLTYSYDVNGQRTSVGGTWARTGLPAALTSATYDNANQIATFGGVTFTYDANGNLTNDGSRSYTWNARNQLASLTGPVNGSFAYDGLARRRSKTISGTTTQLLYDELNPVQELSGGTPTANLLTGLGVDEYFTRADSAGVHNYLTDALGSSVALANGSGIVQTEYTYEAFGGTTTTGASTTNAIGFTGREVDSTALYFYRARYYDAKLQRFIAEDPLEYAGGDPNLHGYVANGPTNFTDPSGEIAPWGAACLAGAGWDAAWYGATHRRKSTLAGVFGAAARGCGAGLVGLGLGRAASWGAGVAARWANAAAQGTRSGRPARIQDVRIRVAVHGPHHSFDGFGGARLPHIQITLYLNGVPNTHVNIRIPLPPSFGSR